MGGPVVRAVVRQKRCDAPLEMFEMLEWGVLPIREAVGETVTLGTLCLHIKKGTLAASQERCLSIALY